jgi:hypothetical protein
MGTLKRSFPASPTSEELLVHNGRHYDEKSPAESSWRSAMRYLKQIVKQIPGVLSAYHFAESLKLKGRTAEDVFTDIRRRNKWHGTDSVSGTGSDLFQTRVVRSELPAVCRYFAVHSMLDIPCGDFHWMKHVDLEGVNYTGADIVTELILVNGQYEASNVHFCKLNLIDDKLPKVDLVLCRDCLVHLSFRDTFIALHNICNSDSTYFLTTTFTSLSHNRDIATGQWRRLNLEIPPFSFPPPLKTINEECTHGDSAFSDKSLGLWRVEDVKRMIFNPGIAVRS